MQMMPLFGVSLDNIGFSLHQSSDYLNATANFSLVARSFNDKSDSWEPLIEPTDGFLRYNSYWLYVKGIISCYNVHFFFFTIALLLVGLS
jgi:hypothetical protein